MSEHIAWRHVLTATLVILGVAVLFSVAGGKPVDAQSVMVDATSVIVLGG